MAAGAVTWLLLVAAAAATIAWPHARRRLSHPSFEKTANAVATWTPCTGLHPWELSKLEDGDILTIAPPDTYFPDRIWDNGTVPILIEMTHFSRDEVGEIRDVIHRINTMSCAKLMEAESYAPDYVRITGVEAGCYSEAWGRRGGMQIVNLQRSACLQRNTIFHELLHVLGLRHMHSAPFRDEFIRVIYANIDKEDQKHFAVYETNVNDSDVGFRYDYDSIMHFSRRAHSMNGKDTIETFDPAALIGRRETPSYFDVGKLKILYDCRDYSPEH